MDVHRLAAERSLALHRVVAARLRADPSVLHAARRRVQDWAARGEVARFYVDEWTRALGQPLEEVVALLLEDSERARALRAVTPFAGVVDPRERWRIWREVRERLEA